MSTKKHHDEFIQVSTATLANKVGINPRQININTKLLPHQLQNQNLHAVLENPITLKVRKSILDTITPIQEETIKTGQVRFDPKVPTISLILGKGKEENYYALILESKEFSPGMLIAGEITDFGLDTLIN